MPYSLRRLSDGAGDSGPMSRIFRHDPTTFEPVYEDNSRPTVDWRIMVGSYTGRTYQLQDWWQTTAVQEILEDSGDRVVFKTHNSIYEWTKF